MEEKQKVEFFLQMFDVYQDKNQLYNMLKFVDKIATNIGNNPLQPKFRVINSQNNQLKQNLFIFPSESTEEKNLEQILFSLGFTLQQYKQQDQKIGKHFELKDENLGQLLGQIDILREYQNLIKCQIQNDPEQIKKQNQIYDIKIKYIREQTRSNSQQNQQKEEEKDQKQQQQIENSKNRCNNQKQENWNNIQKQQKNDLNLQQQNKKQNTSSTFQGKEKIELKNNQNQIQINDQVRKFEELLKNSLKCQIQNQQLQNGCDKYLLFNFNGTEIKVWYSLPQKFDINTSKIIVAMHGMKRNAKSMNKTWSQFSNINNFLIVCPEFDEKQFTVEMYNRGNIQNGIVQNSEDQWTFTAIEYIFEYFKNLSKSQQKGYHIYGHSAGAQFTHRLIIFKKHNRVLSAISANAGVYTFVNNKESFPHGLYKSPVSENDMVGLLGKNYTVLLGNQDNDPNDKDLNKNKIAMKQGLHRFERGQNFYESGKKLALGKLKCNFNWKLKIVDGVSHQNAKMVAIAAQIFQEYTQNSRFQGQPVNLRGNQQENHAEENKQSSNCLIF